MTSLERPQPLGIAPDIDRNRHARALRDILRGEVRFSKHDRMLYATDASLYQVEPIGVVIPADEEDLRTAVQYCNEHRLPMLPRGGGTSLAGQCTNFAVVLDTSATLCAIHNIDPAARTCTVGAGITIDDLNDQLRARGHELFFAPDPSTARQATIAGCIGNDAAGTRSIKYGRTAENLLAVDGFLASGERVQFARGSATHDENARRIATGVVNVCREHESLIRERFPKTLRRNAGYALDMMLDQIDEARRTGRDPLETLNLAHLVCGAEGTLALVTQATLALHPVPKRRALAVLGFNSMDQAIGCVPRLLELGPSAVELLDDLIVGLAMKNIEYRRYVELMPQPTAGTLKALLSVEFSAEHDPSEIEERFNALRALLPQLGPDIGAAYLNDDADIANVLKLRKAGEPLLHAIPGARMPIGFVEDNAVPVENLSTFVREFRSIIESHNTTASFYAHASVGVLHVRPLLNLRDPADCAAMEDIAMRAAELAKSLGGVMSGEHGDGRARGPLLEHFFGPELIRAFREVKAAFDPNGLLNPGNIVEPLPIRTIHEHTRIHPADHDLPLPEIETYMDYAKEGGFDHAVELCNGAGVCRKKQGGTMCPSYMATLDERHSTRGRGNALRLAITGQLRETAHPDHQHTPQWGDPDTLETLELCLSCKACKTECPSNVDIAAYKAEYLAQTYRAANSIPLASRIMSRVRTLNRIGSALAPLSNWAARLAPSRWIANGILNIHPRRTLPPFAPSVFRRSKRIGMNANIPADAPTVLIFADCFTAFSETEIALSTIRVLNAFGYRVELSNAGCCARPAVSLGLLEDAQRTIAVTARRLIADASNAHAIVILEPSCLSAIKDEWLKLKLPEAPNIPTRDELAALADRCYLPEDFLDRHWDDHPAHPRFHRPAGTALLHAHCHQKALWSAESSARFMRRIVGPTRTRTLDTGCCGMAGSFGYSTNRYDLSMKIGELALFPSARAMNPDDVLVAPGASCRHQLHDGVSKTALHPMQWAAALIIDD